MSTRREFITLIGGMAAWPVAAHGEQAGMPVVGWFGSQSQPSEGFRTAPFRGNTIDYRRSLPIWLTAGWP
jgi:hypothetical protein